MGLAEVVVQPMIRDCGMADCRLCLLRERGQRRNAENAMLEKQKADAKSGVRKPRRASVKWCLWR